MSEKKIHFAIGHITREEMTFLENEKQCLHEEYYACKCYCSFMYYI